MQDPNATAEQRKAHDAALVRLHEALESSRAAQEALAAAEDDFKAAEAEVLRLNPPAPWPENAHW